MFYIFTSVRHEMRPLDFIDQYVNRYIITKIMGFYSVRDSFVSMENQGWYGLVNSPSLPNGSIPLVSILVSCPHITPQSLVNMALN